VQHLERDDAVQYGIARLVDDGKAATADLFEDFIFAEALGFCHRYPNNRFGCFPPTFHPYLDSFQ
jgi:hypothetical protein